MQKVNFGGLRAPGRLSILSLAAAVALGSVPTLVSAGGVALSGIAFSPASTTIEVDPRVVDLGEAPANEVRAITVGLSLRNATALETFIANVANPASTSFRKFITPAEFAATYGQTPAAVAQVVSYLTSRGLTITQVYSNSLLISAKGTNAQIAAAFGTPIHSYSLLGTTYEAPASATILPAALSGIATSVSGLSTKASLLSHTAKIPNTGAFAGDVPSVVQGGNVVPASAPGSYTVLDLAAKYNIKPLYAKGLTGVGKTIGIATLAGYNQSDAYTYWSSLQLPVSTTRITDVLVDGGALPTDGPGSEGAGETTLDVEQSGGVAPGANVRVYIAPNTDQGFIDVFAQAISENIVDVLSVSWGNPEIIYDASMLNTYHALFAQAAAQGIPIISAAGDAGAFDINRSFTYPHCSTLLTVDFPAADPLVLAAGGTTLPNTVQHKYGPVTVTAERAWGWDYLKTYVEDYYGTDLYYASYFAVGGGGGVSVDYARPAYQTGLSGVSNSASAQALFCQPAFLGNTGNQYQYLISLPAGVAGRNVPDISLNADPYSGYAVYEGGWVTGSGGTSFVAPQLNGILTLISSGLPGRVGPINPQLYAAFKKQGYGSGSPFKAIASGDNEYYKSTATYNAGTGLGSLDVTALAKALGVN